MPLKGLRGEDVKMATNFKIAFTISNRKLHVCPEGIFDGNSAWDLINLLDDAYRGERQVIIDTERLQEIIPFGCTTFQVLFDLSGIPRDRLIFTGAKGSALAPKGCLIRAEGKQTASRGSGDRGRARGQGKRH